MFVVICGIILAVLAMITSFLGIDRPVEQRGVIVGHHNEVVGGSFYDFTAGVDYRIPKGAAVIIDGHNAIHAIDHATLHDKEAFLKGIDILSKIVLGALPENKIHIVLKNYYTGEKLTDQLSFINDCVRISRKWPAVIYHIAQDAKRPDIEAGHTSRGRDDLLTVWLARHKGYIISQDFFRDVDYFHEIGNFDHYTIRKGKVVDVGLFVVKKAIAQIEKPSHANQLLSRFTEEYSNGTITLHPAGKYKVINFQMINPKKKKKSNKHTKR